MPEPIVTSSLSDRMSVRVHPDEIQLADSFMQRCARELDELDLPPGEYALHARGESLSAMVESIGEQMDAYRALASKKRKPTCRAR